MFREFSTKTSIHGLHYVGDGRKKLDILFWAVLLTLSFVYCSYFIVDLWINWSQNPIAIVYDGSLIDLEDIRFPAITLCPLNKLGESDAIEMYDKIRELPTNGDCNLNERQ